jgi:hypothetical protein
VNDRTSAYAIADQKLWAAHPELKGRSLTLASTDAEYRREWSKYYAQATRDKSAPLPSTNRTPVLGAGGPPPSPQPISPITKCEKQCKDDSERICNCKELTTITLYVQNGDAPLDIFGGFVYDKILGEEPRPNTGHTFLAIGDGERSKQKAYGFYPYSSWLGETGGINTNDGFIVPGNNTPITDSYPPENTHSYSHSKSYKACPAAVATLEASIQKDIAAIKSNRKDAPSYNLARLQCTTWARGKLAELGFSDPGGHSPHAAAEALDKQEAIAKTPDGRKKK